jgi:hypothetical protein
MGRIENAAKAKLANAKAQVRRLIGLNKKLTTKNKKLNNKYQNLNTKYQNQRRQNQELKNQQLKNQQKERWAESQRAMKETQTYGMTPLQKANFERNLRIQKMNNNNKKTLSNCMNHQTEEECKKYL